MTKPYNSLYGQAVYALLSGLQLLFIPNTMLGMFGFPPTHEIWIRVLGMLVVILPIYYVAMARYGNKQVVGATVTGRVIFCAGLVAFVLLNMAKPALILFAVAETALAAWTWWELRNR